MKPTANHEQDVSPLPFHFSDDVFDSLFRKLAVCHDSQITQDDKWLSQMVKQGMTCEACESPVSIPTEGSATWIPFYVIEINPPLVLDEGVAAFLCEDCYDTRKS